MEYITINNTITKNVYSGFKIAHQRELPKTAKLCNCDTLTDINGLMINNINVYYNSSKKSTVIKYYILIKTN